MMLTRVQKKHKDLGNKLYKLWASIPIPGDLPVELMNIFKGEDVDYWLAQFLTSINGISTEEKDRVSLLHNQLVTIRMNHLNLRNECLLYCNLAQSICNLILIDEN